MVKQDDESPDVEIWIELEDWEYLNDLDYYERFIDENNLEDEYDDDAEVHFVELPDISDIPLKRPDEGDESPWLL